MEGARESSVGCNTLERFPCVYIIDCRCTLDYSY